MMTLNGLSLSFWGSAEYIEILDPPSWSISSISLYEISVKTNLESFGWFGLIPSYPRAPKIAMKPNFVNAMKPSALLACSQ